MRSSRSSACWVERMALLVALVAAATMVAPLSTWAAETVTAGEPDAPEQPAALDAAYPGLSGGPLRAACLADLPGEVLLRAGEVSITRAQLNTETERLASGGAGAELRRYPFFVLENLATEALLTAEARAWAAENGQDPQGEALIDSYLQGMADAVTVSDAELRAFYDANPDMFEGKPYAQVVEQLRPYLLYTTRQDAVAQHLATLSERRPVELDAAFVAEAAVQEGANAVAVARRSGRPALVDFGSHGCRPCDMMTPILAELETELAGQCSVLFVSVVEEQILAARYGIRSIPVQVFFDAEGREVFRHVGFFAKDEINAKLKELGLIE